MGPLADLQNVTVSPGGVVVLNELNLYLDEGEVLGIFGPNGTGKSTLIETLATLRRPAKGTALVLGVDDAATTLPSVRSQIGLVTHQPALIDQLTLQENLVHVSRLSGNDEDRIPAILNTVGLGAVGDRMTSVASFGMKRRLELAALILRRPRLVLLDEATTGLDSAAVGLIGAILETTVERSGSAVMVSHDEPQLRATCDRILRLENGRLVSV